MRLTTSRLLLLLLLAPMPAAAWDNCDHKADRSASESLDGIERNLQPPEPLNDTAFGMSETQRAEMGIGELPRSLHEAILLTEQSDLVRGALGDHIFDSFIRNKRIEWDSFRAHVTDFEIDRYLQTL